MQSSLFKVRSLCLFAAPLTTSADCSLSFAATLNMRHKGALYNYSCEFLNACLGLKSFQLLETAQLQNLEVLDPPLLQNQKKKTSINVLLILWIVWTLNLCVLIKLNQAVPLNIRKNYTAAINKQ